MRPTLHPYLLLGVLKKLPLELHEEILVHLTPLELLAMYKSSDTAKELLQLSPRWKKLLGLQAASDDLIETIQHKIKTMCLDDWDGIKRAAQEMPLLLFVFLSKEYRWQRVSQSGDSITRIADLLPKPLHDALLTQAAIQCLEDGKPLLSLEAGAAYFVPVKEATRYMIRYLEQNNIDVARYIQSIWHITLTEAMQPKVERLSSHV